MPYIKDSKYDKSIPFLHKNAHFSTKIRKNKTIKVRITEVI